LVIGQSFDEHWKEIENKYWSMEINSDTTPVSHLKTKTVGKIIFKNLSDSSIITYHVFNTSQIDSVFESKKLHRAFVSSCTIDPMFPGSFLTKDFLYYLIPCDGCFTEKSKECQSLAKEIRQKRMSN